MNGDISLSQSLGGLRIANPDEDTTSPSPPPASSASDSTVRQQPISGREIVTEQPRSSFLPPVHSDDPSGSLGSLGFNPNTFGTDSSSVAPSSDAPRPVDHFVPQEARPMHRQSVSAVNYQPQHHPSSSSNNSRNFGPPMATRTARPMSNIYQHANLSSSSAVSTPGNNYRYRDESSDQLAGAGPSRNSSRGGMAVLQPSGIPPRDSSRNDRSYRQIQGVNGVPPPRTSSRRAPVGEAANAGPSGSSHNPVSPYAVEGGPPQSSEDWKERGAAVSVRQETDADGRPVTKVVRKGVNDFSFGRILGEGSYSTVLAGTDNQTGREYAIKVLDKRHIIREKKVKYVNIEKDTLNRLTEHPGIVRLYYTFQDKMSLYFVLDLANGGELLGFLKKMMTFDVECTRFYGAQILDSIAYMHSRGVIHRDLKPENVLLDANMHVKITDFGTAKILDVKRPANGGSATSGDPLDGAETDRANSFVGTAEYVSPELLTDKNACKASDLWAFGCIIYQLLAGRPPFKAGNEYLTFQKIVGLEFTFPEGFPPAARDLVERLLVLDPAKRLPIEHIRNHEFFDGVVWGVSLWKQKAPRLKTFQPPQQQREPIRLNGPSNATPQPTNQARPQPRVITELPPPSQLDIEWSPVLTRNNERILKLGNLYVTSTPAPHSPTGKGESETPKKFRLFGGNTTKKRQRLVMVTSSARIILAAAGGDEKKSKLEISLLTNGCTWRSIEDSKGFTSWIVDGKDKHYVFEDVRTPTLEARGTRYSTREWLEALDQAREFALSQSMANSYSGESALNEFNSAISSPASTIGGDGAIDGVNIPTARHLRKDDSESIKGRKRFSKRHSKNGLAAVF